MARPEITRDTSKKRIVKARSVIDLIEAGRSSVSQTAAVSVESDSFNDEVRRAMGQTNTPAVETNKYEEYRSAEDALEGFEKDEFKITEAPMIIAKIGLVSDEEAADLTPKQAIASLKEAVREDFDSQKNVPEKKDVPRGKMGQRIKTDAPVKTVAKLTKKIKSNKVLLKKKGAKDEKKEKKDDKKVVKKEKKAVKKSKSQYANPAMPSSPASAPATPTSTTVPITVTDPNTGQVAQYMKQPDGSLMLVQTATAKVEENPTLRADVSDSVREPAKNSPSNLKNKKQEDSAKYRDKVTNHKSETVKDYSAKYENNRWAVYANSNPLFSVSIVDAYPKDSSERFDMWRDASYGEELVSACKMMGAANVINDTYCGHVRMEQRTAFDIEADLVDALDAQSDKADDYMVEYMEKFPEKGTTIKSIYNDKSIPNDAIGTTIRKALLKRRAQIDMGVSNVEQDLSQEPAAVMTPEVAADSVEETDAKKDVVGLVAEVLAPIIEATEVWDVDEAIVQMTETFSDDEAIANFKGILEEKIKSNREKGETVIEEKSEEELVAQEAKQAEDNENLDNYKMAMKTTFAKVRASLGKLNSGVASNKETALLKSRIATLSSELDDSKDNVNKLIKERVARLKLPKAKILAEKMGKIGIKTALKDIVLYSDKQFAEKELEVNQIFAKMTTLSPRTASHEPLIGGSLPTSDAIDEEPKSLFTSRAPSFSR